MNRAEVEALRPEQTDRLRWNEFTHREFRASAQGLALTGQRAGDRKLPEKRICRAREETP